MEKRNSNIYADKKPVLINSIVDYMDRINGMTTVSKICRLFNIAPRTLERHFNETMGISPRKMLRILRVRHAIRLINEKPDIHLTQISYLIGYYDQSHFIRDFRKTTGTTPGSFRVRMV